MEPTMIVVLFLSLALAVVALLALHERRQRRGLQLLLQRVLSITANPTEPLEAVDANENCDARGRTRSGAAGDHRMREG